MWGLERQLTLEELNPPETLGPKSARALPWDGSTNMIIIPHAAIFFYPTAPSSPAHSSSVVIVVVVHPLLACNLWLEMQKHGKRIEVRTLPKSQRSAATTRRADTVPRNKRMRVRSRISWSTKNTKRAVFIFIFKNKP